MVLGKLPVSGRPTIWITVGQGPTALAVGAGGGCLDIFTLIYPFSHLSPSLWETARYRLKYCLKGPLNPKQPTNVLAGQCRSAGVYLGGPASEVSYSECTCPSVGGHQGSLQLTPLPQCLSHNLTHLLSCCL